MNPVAILNTQFVQVALPLMLTLSIMAGCSDKRVGDLRSDMNRRFDEVIKRPDRIYLRLPLLGSRS